MSRTSAKSSFGTARFQFEWPCLLQEVKITISISSFCHAPAAAAAAAANIVALKTIRQANVIMLDHWNSKPQRMQNLSSVVQPHRLEVSDSIAWAEALRRKQGRYGFPKTKGPFLDGTYNQDAHTWGSLTYQIQTLSSDCGTLSCILSGSCKGYTAASCSGCYPKVHAR